MLIEGGESKWACMEIYPQEGIESGVIEGN
jgi:hypothetical protein